MPNWNFYQANINDQISSIYVDLDAKNELASKDLVFLHWLFIKLQVERADGLSHDDEFDRLCKYEDDIVKVIEGTGIYYVGRVTTKGMRQFYFYSSQNSTFDNVISKAKLLNQEYLSQQGTKPDMAWEQFDNVLYPGKFGLKQIKGRSNDT